MKIDVRALEKNLPKKGFIRDDKRQPAHIYFLHHDDGVETGPYTYISHGSSFKEMGPKIIKRMQGQLKLDNNKEVLDLCNCPMSGEVYLEKLRTKGII